MATPLRDITQPRDFIQVLAEMMWNPVAEFLLKEGREWGYQPLPTGWERGEPRQCFRNAAVLALENDELTYVEGYATSLIPTSHAWVVNRDGVVHDPTWANLELEDAEHRAYFGVPFDTAFLARHTVKQMYYGLLVLPNEDLLAELKTDAWRSGNGES